jgi:hypothetical protein
MLLKLLVTLNQLYTNYDTPFKLTKNQLLGFAHINIYNKHTNIILITNILTVSNVENFIIFNKHIFYLS